MRSANAESRPLPAQDIPPKEQLTLAMPITRASIIVGCKPAK